MRLEQRTLIETEGTNMHNSTHHQQLMKTTQLRRISIMSNCTWAGGVEGVANPITSTHMPYENFSYKRGHLLSVDRHMKRGYGSEEPK